MSRPHGATGKRCPLRYRHVQGTLPLRLMSLRYGADSVYSEEIIDRKIASTERIENRKADIVSIIS